MFHSPFYDMNPMCLEMVRFSTTLDDSLSCSWSKLPKVSPEVFPLNVPFAFLRYESDVFGNGALFDNVDDSLSKMVELRRLWSEDFSSILYWWKISELFSSKFQISSILSVFWRTQAPDQIHRLVQLHRTSSVIFSCFPSLVSSLIYL